jgi:FkbM family methyltransferase
MTCSVEPGLLARQFHRRWKQNNSGRMRARLARWRVLHWVMLQRLGFTVWAKVPLFFGPRMCVLTGETVSKALLAFGYTETALTALLLEFLEPGMTFVDIGAHFGYEAMLGSALVGPTGHVVSFEPQPEIAAIAKQNLSLFAQTRLVEAAVGEADGSLDLQNLGLKLSAFAGRAGSHGGPTITVPMVTLASVLRADERPIDMLKCDAEGGEIAVLHGSLDLIKNDRPLLVLEGEMPADNPNRPRIKEFERLLEPLDYRALLFDFGGGLRVGMLGDFEPGHANVAFFPPAWRARLAARFGDAALRGDKRGAEVTAGG